MDGIDSMINKEYINIYQDKTEQVPILVVCPNIPSELMYLFLCISMHVHRYTWWDVSRTCCSRRLVYIKSKVLCMSICIKGIWFISNLFIIEQIVLADRGQTGLRALKTRICPFEWLSI